MTVSHQRIIRGTIYSKNGKKLAYTDTKNTESDLTDDTREYPYGNVFSHAIGITTHGKYGLEKMCNYDLLSSQTNVISKIVDDFTDNTEKGCDVHTTLSVNIQKTAYNSLKGNKCAGFCNESYNRRVYSMVSLPSYESFNNKRYMGSDCQ